MQSVNLLLVIMSTSVKPINLTHLLAAGLVDLD